MPSRVIRDGILESDAINSLSWEAELFYRRLMSIVDDFGRYSAHPMLLRSRSYPMQFDRVKDTDILKWLKECKKVGIMCLYSVENKPFLELTRFNQRTRQQCSKFPGPDDCITNVGQRAAARGQVLSSAHEDEGEGEGEDEDETRKRVVSLPKGWKPKDAHKKLAKEKGVDIEAAFDYFKDWAKGGGHKRKDWDATFRNGLKTWLKERCPEGVGRALDATGEELKKWK